MHISLDSALGRQRRLNSVGESVLQIAPDAAAAYSLRSLTGGDPDVVRVRRESDNTEKDFSGSQIESGEMARWVNEQPTLPLDLRELDTNTGERDGALIEAAAAYSLRKLKEDFTGDVVEVRRNVDGETEGFTADEVTDGTLESFVNASFDDELPLDQATGAAAAYSLRKLSSSFTGDVVQVRRSSDDAVKSFTASEVADGTLEDWVNAAASSLFNSAYYFDGDVHSNVNLSSDITLQDGESMSLKYFWGGTTTGVEVLLDSGGAGTNSLLILTDGRIRIRINAEEFNFSAASALVANSIDTLTIARSGNTISVTTASGTESNTFTSGDFKFRRIGGTSASQSMNGVFYDLAVGSRHSYTGLGATAWEDTIGSNNGTASNLVLFTGQELDGHVRTWYDQSGSDNHAVQTTPANQPKIVEGGSLNRDSDNNVAVKFDSSSDQYLENASLPSSFTSSNVTFSDFTVQEALQNNVTTTAWGFGSTVSSATRLTKLFHSGGNFGYQGYGSTASYVSAFDAASYSANEVLLSSGVRVGTDLDIFKNSADADMDNSFDTGTINLNTFAIGSYVRSSGSTNPFNGNIAEVIIYDSDQSTKRRAIEENIANHYDISLAAFSRDGTVSTWYDQSGNTNDATQTDPTNQPKIVEGGNLVTDGIDFDGSGDELNLSGAGLDIFKNVGYGQVFSVVTSDETGLSTANIFGALTGTGVTRFLISESNVTSASFRIGGRRLDADSFDSTTASVGHGNTERLVTGFLNWSDGEAYLYQDGTNVGTDLSFQTAGNTENTSSSAAGIGRGNFDGRIREIIVYNSDQSDNRTAIEANIGETYGITDIPAANDTVNGFVQTWYDQSGNVPANDAVQTTAANQPKIVEGGTYLEEIKFESGLYLAKAGLSLSGPFSTFSVSNANSQHNGALLTFGNFSQQYRANRSLLLQYGDTNFSSADVYTTGEQNVMSFIFDSTSLGYYNGTEIINDAATGATATQFRVGNSSFGLDGDVKEVIIYNSNQSSNRPAIEANIANQYGITLS